MKGTKMKNADKIRQFLTERIAITKRRSPLTSRLVDFTIQDAEAILDLLPCETCNGTGEKRVWKTADHLHITSCPSCQSPKEKSE